LGHLADMLTLLGDPLLAEVYSASGMEPWKLGYSSYKRRLITRYLRDRVFSLEDWPTDYGYRVDERIIEYPWLFWRLGNGPEVLLDAGSALNYRLFIGHRALAQKRLFIATLAPERRNFAHRGVSYVFEDLRDSCFRADFFDTIVSISTLEHVGLDNTLLYTRDVTKQESRPDDYRLALSEYRRILKAGGRLLLSFPFGCRKNCGWYQVFDEDVVADIIRSFQPDHYQTWYFRYHREGWRPSTAEACGDAVTSDSCMTKRYEEDDAAFSRAVCCMELYK
jgi:SAM-dependent methyltransferase